MNLWRQIQKKNFTSWPNLANFLELDLTQFAIPKSDFPLNVPLRLAQKMQKNNLQDPILRQFLPSDDEANRSSSFIFDPVGDEVSRKNSRILHKYHGRVLLICTQACAMHCRYCFRQHFDYASGQDLDFVQAIQYICQDSTIREVILSGGDPLSLSNERLAGLLGQLQNIPHIKKIRFHTRFPIGIPERIDAEFLAILSNCKCQIFFVIHCNHPLELDNDIFSALKSVQKLGIPVLNQTVLLKGINDCHITMIELCHLLTDHGILPYYLHQLDRVAGAERFETSVVYGLELIKELQCHLPGYGIPKYVQEIAGTKNKTHITYAQELSILESPSHI